MAPLALLRGLVVAARRLTVRLALRVSLVGLVERRDEIIDGGVLCSAAFAAIVPTMPPIAAPTGPATTAPNTAPVTAAAGFFGIRRSLDRFVVDVLFSGLFVFMILLFPAPRGPPPHAGYYPRDIG